MALSGHAHTAEGGKPDLTKVLKWTLAPCALVQVSNSVAGIGAGKRLWLSRNMAAMKGGKVMVSDNVTATAFAQSHPKVDLAQGKP